jgi:hypothetical protein
VADFEQLLNQGGIEQQDDADRALMDRDMFVTCLRQQVRLKKLVCVRGQAV